MSEEFSREYQDDLQERLNGLYEDALKRYGEKHLQIHIFPDDSVFITDKSGEVIAPMGTAEIDGPENTYQQAVWVNLNPRTCVWFNGKRYCG